MKQSSLPKDWIENLYEICSKYPGNTKGGSIIVPLTSCLTGLKSAV